MSIPLDLLVLQFMTLQKKKKMARMDISVKSYLLKRNEWPIVLKCEFFFTCIMSFYNFFHFLVLSLFQSILEDGELLKWGYRQKQCDDVLPSVYQLVGNTRLTHRKSLGKNKVVLLNCVARTVI